MHSEAVVIKFVKLCNMPCRVCGASDHVRTTCIRRISGEIDDVAKETQRLEAARSKLLLEIDDVAKEIERLEAAHSNLLLIRSERVIKLEAIDAAETKKKNDYARDVARIEKQVNEARRNATKNAG